LSLILNPNTNNKQIKGESMRGLKVYDQISGNLEKTVEEWKILGFDTVFPYPDYVENSLFLSLIERHEINLFLTVPGFYNPKALDRNPKLYAIKADGTPAIRDWVRFVCPSKHDYKEKRLQDIISMIRKYRPSGISLDFIRFFVFWEKVFPETPASELPQTCFCPDCINSFSQFADLDIRTTSPEKAAAIILKNHKQEWKAWKCHVITETVKEFAQAIRAEDKNIKINLHVVPWMTGEFDDAIKRIAGQDIEALSEIADYISPMCYSHMLRRPPQWINKVVADMNKQSKVPIIPCIQVAETYRPEPFTDKGFASAVQSALAKPSAGIIIWSWKALEASEQKKRIIAKALSRE